MRRLALLTVGLITALLLNTAAAQTLKIGSAEWRPWQILENGQLKGITPDLLRELSKRTGFAMDMRWLPHNRVQLEFESGLIDMEPTVNPIWRETSRVKSVYTLPFYSTGDIILIRKESGIQGTAASAFHGLKLGCGLGYYYPEGFQEAFDRGDIIREDNPVSEANIKKLALKRIDGIIVDRIQAKYIMKKVGLSSADFATAYAFKPSKLSLRLHKNRKDLLPVLNEALSSMQADGSIERIVSSYLE